MTSLDVKSAEWIHPERNMNICPTCSCSRCWDVFSFRVKGRCVRQLLSGQTSVCNCCPSPPCVQRQVSGEVRVQPQSSLIDPIAMTMAAAGMGVSLYSARQMAESVRLRRPAAWERWAALWAVTVTACCVVYVAEGLRKFVFVVVKEKISRGKNVSYCWVLAGRITIIIK